MLCEVIPAVQFVIIVVLGQVTLGLHQAYRGPAWGIQQPKPWIKNECSFMYLALKWTLLPEACFYVGWVREAPLYQNSQD